MSNKYFDKQWIEVQNELLEILELEPSADPSRPPEKNLLVAFQSVAVLFLKYISVFRNLDVTYDQIVHPQKRRVIRIILDGTMGRILELKNEMVTLECLDFHFYDDLLTDLKMTPADIEIPIPKYFLQEQADILNERRDMLQNILDRMYPKAEEILMAEDDAILLIQSHERARQDRLRIKFLLDIQKQESKTRRKISPTAKPLTFHQAAVIIQKIWKMYITKKKSYQLRQEELIFLGMISPSSQDKYDSILKESAERCEQRRVIRDEHEVAYLKAIETIKIKVKKKEGEAIKEKLEDQIRQWFLECRNATGQFPDLPDEDEGGTSSLFVMKDPEELKQELIQMDEEAEKKDDKKDKGKDKGKDKKEKEKPKEKEKKKKDEEEEEGWQMSPSNFLPIIHEGDNTYKNIWKNRRNSKTLPQPFDELLIKEEKLKEVEEEIRIEVDELMRQELERLRMIVDKDTSKPKKKKKKKKKEKEKKKKKEKDLTPDRTLESLFEELVLEGVLIKSDPVRITDIVGEMNYVASTLLQGQIQPMPCLADIRQLLTCYAILPLGSQIVHEKIPVIRSILLAGPIGVGKRSLIQAVCHETGANLFDLSAVNIAGKYPGKKGLDMLMHLVLKVGRLMQPSVIYLNEAEKLYQKKIPKADLKTDPRRLKKELPKLVKKIQSEDRLIVIGTSHSPYNAQIKPLAKCFQKIILVPRPDYSSRKLIWTKLITDAGGIITGHLDLGTLSKISDGYVGRHFQSSVSEIMTEKRLVTQKTNPLTAYEFIQPLTLMEPVLKTEEEMFQKWYEKTPLGKKRQSLFVKDEDEGGKDKKGGKDKGKKGKK